MKILKASAGSGKTYQLSKAYRNLLLESDDPYAYRHILAVTFTNKATAEMKERILEDLAKAAPDDRKAGEILINILHDYSAFSVSTIDRFFQRTLKGFSREIGQFADYQVELDRKSLISESMDRILDSLTDESGELLDWIRTAIISSLEDGKHASIEADLHKIGGRLKNDQLKELLKSEGLSEEEAFSKRKLLEVSANCREIIRKFTEAAKAAGAKIEKGKRIEMPGPKWFKSHPEHTDLFDRPYKIYFTAYEINSALFSLGLAGEFYRSFNELCAEKNVMCLDESNHILKDIIAGSDAPFVYEKTGTRYDHFLLDEFQDTSRIQWENFRPLIAESESRGGKNLIVGDIKQSIYRWRNSDWRLLGVTVPEEFPDCEKEPLDNNWRSAKKIVEFNNGFFKFAAANLGLEEKYGDVVQTSSSGIEGGSVRADYCDDMDRAILDSIAEALEAGFRLGDIVILVRRNNTGLDIASLLLENDIPVVSDDSLSLKSSLEVRRLISLLSCIDDPNDEMVRYVCSNLDVELPSEYLSLSDLVLRLLDRIPRNPGEKPYVNALLDDVCEWSATNGNDLHAYLKHWEESDLNISSGSETDTVRIMTIHKSKGLQFPYVIFPYADEVKKEKGEEMWVPVKGEETLNGIYPVSISGKSRDSLFSGVCDELAELQAMDQINLFYVACTRAVNALHIICGPATKKVREAFEKGEVGKCGTMADLLYFFTGGGAAIGKPDASGIRRRTKADRMPFEERAIPTHPMPELGVKFSTPSIREGIALHELMAAVERPGDLEKAIQSREKDGRISPEDAAKARELLGGRIASHPEWFPEKGSVILNEVPVISGDGGEKRPDRVILSDSETIIVDYKFGEAQSAYSRQVKSYCKLYREMGYPGVKGYIWYIPTDSVEAI